MAKNMFNSVQVKSVPGNRFDLIHDVKTSTIMGRLTPICILETLPGDKYSINTESLIRFAPMVSPVMHRMNVFMHYYFVPNRIVWPGWEDFISPPTNTSIAPAFPTITFTQGNPSVGNLGNYLGINPTTGLGSGQVVSALAFAAYQAIYHEYYRDQNLIPEFNYKLANGDNSSNLELIQIRKRAWEHDYFTSALPFAQKGAAVAIPIGQLDDVPVKVQSGLFPGGDIVSTAATGLPSTTAGSYSVQQGSPNVPISLNDLYADMSNATATATTINDLRTAIKLQEWLEKNARSGTRYNELVKAHWNEYIGDDTLQRPEYITGSKSPVVISEVLNSTGETGGLPQGNMAGHGFSTTSGKQGYYHCKEHGYIIGIMSVMPTTVYQQGTPKHFLKTESPEFGWPSFANLGEQEIINKELYVDHSQPNDVFGYIPRFSEYKYIPSMVTGDMQGNLNYWTISRIFGTDPDLNQTFIECDPRLDFLAVPGGGDYLYCQVLNNISAFRKLPKYGTPTF